MNIVQITRFIAGIQQKIRWAFVYWPAFTVNKWTESRKLFTTFVFLCWTKRGNLSDLTEGMNLAACGRLVHIYMLDGEWFKHSINYGSCLFRVKRIISQINYIQVWCFFITHMVEWIIQFSKLMWWVRVALSNRIVIGKWLPDVEGVLMPKICSFFFFGTKLFRIQCNGNRNLPKRFTHRKF